MGCTVEFKLQKDDNRGIYYEETNRCLIYLPMHETIEDVYKTISHEVFHYCLEDNGVQLDEEQEEKLIFNIQWAEIAL